MNIESHLASTILLIVDDNQANVLIATTCLDDLGYRYDIAENGEEAVKLFKLNRYALILMDIQMPIMSGVEATKHIRQYELEQRQTLTPIIALTANNTLSDRADCIACGMNDFLAKPYLLEDLSVKILNNSIR